MTTSLSEPARLENRFYQEPWPEGFRFFQLAFIVDDLVVAARKWADVYGIGPFLAEKLCEQATVDPDKQARELTEDELAKLATLLDNEYVVEGQLRRQVQQNIARLRDIGCYRGLRHRKGLPVRGQKTKTNARTRKGPKRMQVAGKKKAGKK